MRLLVWGDAAQTGFGRVTRELTARFLAAGVDVRGLAINFRGRDGELLAYMTRQRSPEEITDFLIRFDSDPVNGRLVPASVYGDTMGHKAFAAAIEGSLFNDDWRPDAVLCVADPRAMGDRLRNRKAVEAVPFWNYVPIEGRHLPPAWRTMWDHVQPVAMSDFGRAELEALLERPVPMIPHGLSDAFYPIAPDRPSQYGGAPVQTKDDAKAAMELSGRTVFLRTDRLVPRKNYPALFRTMAPVLEQDPSNVLVIHCAPEDEGGRMAELVSEMPGSFGIGDRWQHPQVRFTGGHDTFRGWSDADLNLLYNAADVYVSPTMAEGFGLTLLEAAATATAVVTTDYAAGPEAVGPGALLVQPKAYSTNTAAHDWALVDEERFTLTLSELAADPVRRHALGAAGAAHAAQFSWDTAASQFLALMG